MFSPALCVSLCACDMNYLSSQMKMTMKWASSESGNADVTYEAFWDRYVGFKHLFQTHTPTQLVIFHRDLAFWFFSDSSGSVCSRSVPQSVAVLVCPPPKDTFLCGTCPRRQLRAFWNFKTNRIQKGGQREACSWRPTGERRGLWGITASLILHFSSPQHLL